ncbi:MAG: UDP-3-O-(3-hydroxymyristoyl)glucosamine N-acyltransferase [Candidatus Omnitrophica bacterium]|nr:UDP-3-O-(3-hydroxymyristoyl)glucosamine N-acyltransferase [Candidatus Omnitrophota bacterium]
MCLTLGEIAKKIDGKVVGDKNTVITGISGIKEAKKGDITFLANPRYARLLSATKASAVIVARDITNTHRALIQTDDPYFAFSRVMGLLANEEVPLPRRIHPTAVIGKRVKLGSNIAVSAFVVIEDDVEIGDGVTIYPQVYIGHHTRIGQDTLIYAHVTIREKVTIGRNVIIHSGTVIGCDGFGFAPFKGKHHKVPQMGTVVIGDDVEIGANVTIDRGTIGETKIGQGTKIDNLVQIAHNVVIGENSIIIAQTGISGSTTLGKNVTLAGQVGVIGHLTIGDNAVVAAKSGVAKSVPANTCVMGIPAREHVRENRVKASMQNLPELVKEIHKLKKEVEELKKRR